MKLNNYALVTGAASGLGAALSERLINEDYIVIGIDQSQDWPVRLQKKFNSNFIPICLDLKNTQELHGLKSEIEGITDKLDLVVFNAGLNHCGRFFSNLKVHLDVINTNLISQLIMISELETFLKKDSQILVISSTASLKPSYFQISYGLSKSSLNYFWRSIRKELRQKGISVTLAVVCAFKSPFLHKGNMDLSRHPRLLPLDYVAGKCIRAISRKRRYVFIGVRSKLQYIVFNLVGWRVGDCLTRFLNRKESFDLFDR
ncbi:MAG: SDR family NAD(P)-dependent oxidoreductase [Bacteriovoracaceae bacterium]|nr:SDR family NAD(P)-dependent oxidoreductase [Bacteriovoracaceae bacterium]